MCGICGQYNFKSREPVFSDRLRVMNETLRHRGPNDEGYYLDGPVGLAMRRLSIIDVVGGKQPIHNEDQTLWIVFNGEIFNYSELRHNLEKKGHRFSTASDTETIIHLYEDYGESCVDYLRGDVCLCSLGYSASKPFSGKGPDRDQTIIFFYCE